MTGAEAAVWASAIIGGAVTLTTAMIKLISPQRHVNGDGERLATKLEAAELRGRVAQLEQTVNREFKYMHRSIHALRNSQNKVLLKLAVLTGRVDDDSQEFDDYSNTDEE